MNEVKNFTPIDLPLLRRLASRGLSLDTVALIRDANPLETALLGAVGLTGRGRPTFILRTEDGDYAAQIQLEATRARLTLLAPTPLPEHRQTPWLALIENILEQAGRRGAYLVTAEVPVEGITLELCRRAGFTVYSRQTLFYLDASSLPQPMESERLFVRPLQDSDHPRLNALYANTVPRLVQQADPPPPNGWMGWALMLDGRLRGYVCVWEGRQSLLLQPYFHPELYDLTTEAFTLILASLPRRKIYIRLLAHQEWMRRALEMDLGFAEWARSALIARHTTVSVKETHAFSPLAALEYMGFAPGVEMALESTFDCPWSDN